jgi:hypothetical protein
VSAPCSDWPSTPDFHPEFGLLCPSPRRRRSMRLAMACVIAGVAIRATMELAIAHWRDSDAASPVVSSIDREPPVEDAAVPTISDVPVISVPHAASTNDAGAATATRTQGVCKEVGVKDLAAEFLNPTCGSGKPRARHATRTTNRVATMIVSRIEPVPAAAEPAPVTQATVEPPRAAVSAALKVAASTTQPVERAMPSPRKPKIAPNAAIVLAPPTREPIQPEAGFSAFAAVPRLGRGYDDGPADASRAAAPPSFGSPFGGIR